MSILSDEAVALTEAGQLSAFDSRIVRLLKLLTLIVVRERTEHVFVPVFPPDQHIHELLGYIQKQNTGKHWRSKSKNTY